MNLATTGLVAAAETTFSLDGDVVVRLLGASVLGGLVGLERETTEQEAGLRTHIAVALGAALFGVISTLGFLEVDRPRAESTVQVDVSRVASNVVVGIGFLGAGVIFRRGNRVKNLTTAASLWTVAAIGLACGVGDVTTAAVATAVLLASLILLRPVRSLVRRRWASRAVTMQVHLRPGADPAATIDAIDGAAGVEAENFALHKEDDHIVISTEIAGRRPDANRWIAEVAASPDVVSIDEA